jgi:hypothetical protein
LTNLFGASVGSQSIDVPAEGQTAAFLDQLPGIGPAVRSPFQGILRISTNSGAGVSVLGLRGRYNERSEFLMTTIPPAAETFSNESAALVFPLFDDGGGYTTQFVIFSTRSGGIVNGVMAAFSKAGQLTDLTLR